MSQKTYAVGDVEETPFLLKLFGFGPYRRKRAEYGIKNNFGARFWDCPLEELDCEYEYFTKEQAEKWKK